ncbi:protein crumbs homolog 1 [Gastrophryne carolinensis]
MPAKKGSRKTPKSHERHERRAERHEKTSSRPATSSSKYSSNCATLNLFAHCHHVPPAITNIFYTGPAGSGSVCHKNETHCSTPPCKFAVPCKTVTGCEVSSDPCLSYPCPKNATCQVTLETGTYECRCQAGYKGRNCEIRMKRCQSNLCRHGGQCYETDRGPMCFCTVGYKGTFCETPEDECLWNPCQNGAVCRDRGNGQACYCVPGFQGALCDIEVDECISNPCQHGGTCLNQIGTYVCDCPLEYTGRNCEIEFDECLSSPCLNGATCLDLLGSFSCTCPAGFSGLLCQVNINECESSPCLNGGLCVDENNGYQCDCIVGYTGNNCEVFSPFCSSQPCRNNTTCTEDSAGFRCLCSPGVHCEQDINKCELNPCQNGGTCENLHGSYTCHCPTMKDTAGHTYGGPDCTEVLQGCEKQKCYNGGSCVPYLTDRRHYHTCLCLPGFVGPDCRIQTTFSFNGRTILPIKNRTIQGFPFSISLSFCTVQLDAVIFHLESRSVTLKLYIQNSLLYLTFYTNPHKKTHLHLSQNVSDNLWHTVEINITNHILLKLDDPSCSTTCITTSSYDGPTNIVFQEMLVGGVQPAEENKDLLETQAWLVGCLRNIRVGSTVITEDFGKSVGVAVGCKKKDHCENQPCKNRGKCINLWLSYYCDCYRPYTGINCSSEYDPVAFGRGNVSSYMIFEANITHSDVITVSAFVKPAHHSGLLFALGNATAYDITVYMEDGFLKGKVGNDSILVEESYINDFQYHLIVLKLKQTTAELSIVSPSQAHISMDLKRGLTISALYVGGLVDSLETTQRGGYFKGCIQDLRINDTILEFFPTFQLNGNQFLSNVSKGCTDSCTFHTTGKTCEQNWCLKTPCPPGSVCQPLSEGYECISIALFRDEGYEVTFRSNGHITRDLTNLTISFRTQKSDSVLLHATREPERVIVSIQEEKLHFHLQSGNGLSSISLLGTESVSDSQWHTVTLSMMAPGSQFSIWQMEIDNISRRISSSFATGNLNFLKEDAIIYIGASNNDSDKNFSGCLGTVLIGGIHLPYLSDSDYLITKPQKEQFIKISEQSIATGCLEYDPCASNPCMNGGSCNDVFTHPVCTCPSWKTGTFCENDINRCLPNLCLHGQCTLTLDGYKCECDNGYAGPNCSINSCVGHLCAKGATCVVGRSGYRCLCPANFSGLHCSVYLHSETPAVSLVRILSKMPSRFCGDEKKNITCYNYSNCTEVNGVLGCSCEPGFVGERCEIDYDECESNPCLNGGICQNLPNRFHCICDLNFAGEFCEFDMSDFLPPGVFTAVASVVLILFFAVCAGLCIFIAMANMRSSRGTYSPSRQEKEGSRVEMWNIAQPPPLERLI